MNPLSRSQTRWTRQPWTAVRLALASAVAVLASFASFAATRAQGGITVTSAPEPEYTFGETITFQVSARSPSPINAATLYIRREPGQTPIHWPAVGFDAAKQITATTQIDLAISPLPPFAPIEYWWEVTDESGASTTTDAVTFTYEDNRFTWQTATDGALTAHWYQGDEAFGQTALTIATKALAQASLDIRSPLPERLDLYIYASTSDVQAALKRIGRVWADGHADPELGVVIVAVAPTLTSEINLGREIPHEITHILLYRATGPNYDRLPAWLNEGLAVINQAQPDAGFPAAMAAARDARQFISLKSLCGPFPDEQLTLAYAQSASIVGYIRDQYGSEKLHALISAYSGGAECEAAVQTSLGLSLERLQRDWQSAVIYPDQLEQRWRVLSPWLVLSCLILLGPVILLLTTLDLRRRVPRPT